LLQQKKTLYDNRNRPGELIDQWVGAVDQLDNRAFSAILTKKIKRIGNQYIDVIRSLDADETAVGSAWLQQIVDDVTEDMLAIFPGIR
jgi:hypothetical protein